MSGLLSAAQTFSNLHTLQILKLGNPFVVMQIVDSAAHRILEKGQAVQLC
jgi:hypothetical protein